MNDLSTLRWLVGTCNTINVFAEDGGVSKGNATNLVFVYLWAEGILTMDNKELV